MDNTGEDSGLDIEDNSNIADENVSLQQAEGIDETDEGISFAGNLSNQHIAPCFLPRLDQDFDNQDGDAVGDVEAALFQQQLEMGVVFAENSNSSSANQQEQEPEQPSEENSSDGADNENDNDNDNARREELDVPPVGDDNNNDRPDDVNNNTTDPQLQQLQHEQQQLLLQQRQQQQQQQQIQNQIRRAQLQAHLNSGNSGDSNSQSRRQGQDDLIENSDKKGKDKKKKKKKKKKKNRLVIGSDGVFRKQASTENSEETVTENSGEQNENDLPEDEVEIEYVPEKLELSVFDPMYRAFANVFENFRISEIKKREEIDESKQKAEEIAAALTMKKIPKVELDDDLEELNKDDEKPKLSKRKLKKLTRLSIAELKQVVPRPDVVEMHDVTARDPKLLVHLKSYRNTVPVPRHWCYKRKYLQGKRGIEKAPFDLPAFIKKTGIMEMRAALAEKEETKTLKAKIRERVRPKMGKIDIDYQKLHDAFFKWQSKPKMTIHGDLYYEGKEFETRMKDKKPGELSDDLRTSLGMPVGPNSQRVPPPWLIAMQRYGPPPSYPHLKVPGLNAPIPEGCSFGYHAGGWGKPPVDEFGRPLYGDVFGLTGGDGSGALEDEVVDTTLWGELESEEEVESEEEEEEDEEEKEEQEVEESGLQTPAEGLQTPSGFSSIPAGLETPELIELRKKRIEQDMEGGETPSLYTVLPEKRVDRISGSMMASTHTYDLSGVNKEKAGPAGPRGMNLPGAPMGAVGAQGEQGRVELILDPSELDLVDNEGTLAARYEQQLKEQQSHLQKEDLSDMVAEHAAKQKSKRKRQMQQQDVKQAKKYKEFKF